MLKGEVDRTKIVGVRALLLKKVKKLEFRLLKKIFHDFCRYTGPPRKVSHQVEYKTAWSSISLKFVKNSVWALQRCVFESRENGKK